MMQGCELKKYIDRKTFQLIGFILMGVVFFFCPIALENQGLDISPTIFITLTTLSSLFSIAAMFTAFQIMNKITP